MIDAKANKAKFEMIVFENIKREGIGELMDWLNITDFFSAPASTKFHLAEEGGLCDHSLRVYELLYEKREKFLHDSAKDLRETFAIAGLFHDVCKTNFYIKEFYREEGADKVKYSVEDSLPVGHGEKSVFLLQKFIKLTDMEIAMIRWHMAAYDPSIHFNYPNGYAYQDAVKLFPTIYLMITADLEATMQEGML